MKAIAGGSSATMETLYRKQTRTTQELFLRLLGEGGPGAPLIRGVRMSGFRESQPSVRPITDGDDLPPILVPHVKLAFSYFFDYFRLKPPYRLVGTKKNENSLVDTFIMSEIISIY